MCGRYAITSPPEAIRKLFGYDEQPNFPRRYNVAPTQPIPIVRARDQAEWEPVGRPDRAQGSKGGARSDAKPVSTFADRALPGERHFALVRWGLIPAWVEDPKTFSLVINARGDSVNVKPAFRNAMRYRRCLIPADGFFEWQDLGGGPRRPFYVRRKDGAPFAFAGLWEAWTGPNGEEMETAAIVTTEANNALRPIHPRMPVIIAPEAFDLWLDCRNVDTATASALIVPAPDNLLEAWPVSTAVNRVTNDDASLIVPMSDAETASQTGSPRQKRGKAPPKSKKDGRQPSLF